jgi:hypothetical protein
MPRCPGCYGALEITGATWTCHRCRETQLLARCMGCGHARWAVGGVLPAGWLEVRTPGRFLSCCSGACGVLIVDQLAGLGLVALTPPPPPAPPAGPPPAPAS